jgi:hypothetical protein
MGKAVKTARDYAGQFEVCNGKLRARSAKTPKPDCFFTLRGQ